MRMVRFVVFRAIGGSDVAFWISSFVTFKFSSLASPTNQITVFKKLEESAKVAS